MHKFAEIWSLAWSPDNSYIATASEDQTTMIWNLYGEHVATLTGHTTAVTSVDWQITQLGEILATCADDKTVRIYDGKTWELLHIFESHDVEEWHTITYLALETGGKRLACATQNGFLIVWDLESKKRVFGHKMHAGSIEGLRWNHKAGLITTCSSDCTVNTYHFVENK
jgi:WD40 repeat protein